MSRLLMPWPTSPLPGTSRIGRPGSVSAPAASLSGAGPFCGGTTVEIIADAPFSVGEQPESLFDIQADRVELTNGALLSTDTFGRVGRGGSQHPGPGCSGCFRGGDPGRFFRGSGIGRRRGTHHRGPGDQPEGRDPRPERIPGAINGECRERDPAGCGNRDRFRHPDQHLYHRNRKRRQCDHRGGCGAIGHGRGYPCLYPGKRGCGPTFLLPPAVRSS